MTLKYVLNKRSVVRVQCVSHQHSVREFCSHHTKPYLLLLKRVIQQTMFKKNVPTYFSFTQIIVFIVLNGTVKVSEATLEMTRCYGKGKHKSLKKKNLRGHFNAKNIF